MMRKIKISVVLLIAALIISPASLFGQKMPKKHKSAPDETIIVVVNTPNSTFNENEYPHLKFYYMPETTPDFITRVRQVISLPPNQGVSGFVIDKNGVIVYQRGFSNSLAENNDNGNEFEWTILTVGRKGVIGEKGLLVDYLNDYVIKGKSGREDDKKFYKEGTEPSFKDWEKGDLEGMKLPDFKIVKQDGTETSIKTAMNGKPAFIVFTKIDPGVNYNAGGRVSPMLWHIENIMYNYFPPRKK